MHRYFPRALRPVSLIALGLFVLLCILRLHGFSLPAWHSLIDDSEPTEVLAGRPRLIRTDDWMVTVPLLLSQDAQTPKFPAVSDLIGYGGVDTLVGYSLPVRSWVSVFRPQIWGYFVGRDFGMAWQWWLRIFLLWYAALLALLLVTRGHTAISLLASFAVVVSPFFQFWAFNCEPAAAMALLCFVGAAGVALARTGRSLFLWGALLAWSGGCFALAFVYPPFQIVLAWLVAFLAAGYFLREREHIRAAGRTVTRAGVAAGAVLVAIAALACFFLQHRDAIGAVAATVYPGQRVSSGGELPLAQLFSSFFTAFLGADWRAVFQNVSETGSFFLFAPLMGAVVAWEWGVKKRRPDPVFVALALYFLLASVYAVVGAPEGLAHLLFAGRVPGGRMVVGLGLADMLMLALFLSSRAEDDRAVPRGVVLVGALVWALTMCGAGFAVGSRVQGASHAGVIGVGIALFAVAIPIVRRQPAALVVLAIASLVATIGFNPLVHAGSDYLFTNPFSRKVLELDREGGGKTRWVVYDAAELANLFRAIGVRAINGAHYYPQLALWSRLGATEMNSEVRSLYNRYANVIFRLPQTKTSAELQLANEDALLVSLHPDDPTFAKLDLDYLVYVGPTRAVLGDAKTLTWIASIGDKHIFRVGRDGVPNPDTASSYDRGNTLFAAGRLDDAIAQYNEALHLEPDRADVHNNLGNALATRGDAATAIDQYQQALRLKPGFAEAHNNLGAALVRQGHIDEAIEQYREALRVFPGYAEAANNLGLALAASDLLAEAIASYEQALKINPYYAEAHNGLGIALARSNRLPEAAAHFREAVRIKPDFDEARSNLKRAE